MSISRTRSKLKQRESVPLLLNLPEEVHDEIFLKLPAKSILESRCVCKHFYNLLSKPNFIKNHVNRTNQSKNSNPKLFFSQSPGLRDYHPKIYSIPVDYASISSALSALSLPIRAFCFLNSDEAVQINYPFESMIKYNFRSVGTCNGLICSRITRVDIEEGHYLRTIYFSILNPLTREFKEFFPRYGLDGYSDCGFGYDSNKDDYKLVMVSGYEEGAGCKIDVYTVKSDSWNRVQGTFNYSVLRDNGESLFFNGALHWLGSISNQQTSSTVILCFDISSETMMDIPLPGNIMPPIDFQGDMYSILGVWGDCICVAFTWKLVRIDVWVMQEYGVKESWTKRFTSSNRRLTRHLFRKPLWCYDNGEILIDFGKHILLYDPKTEKIAGVKVRDITMGNQRGSYVESIVPLGSGTYV